MTRSLAVCSCPVCGMDRIIIRSICNIQGLWTTYLE